MTSFSLPWYAIVGAQKGVTVGLPRELRKGGLDRGLRAHKATRGRGGAPTTSVQ